MTLSKNWDLQISRSVFRALKKLPKRNAMLVLDAVKLLPQNPYLGDIQKMKGEKNVWRKRIGVYRIFYEIVSTEKCIVVFHLERRASHTY